MSKYFVIRQSPPTSNSFEPRKNSVPVAFSFCAYFLQQIPIEGFHFTSAICSDLQEIEENFEVLFQRRVQIALPNKSVPGVYKSFPVGNGNVIGQQVNMKEIEYTLTVDATPLLPLADDFEPMFWFLEEVTKAEYENGVSLMKLPALTSHLNAEAIES